MGTTAAKEISYEVLWKNKSFSVRRYPVAVIAEVIPLGKNAPGIDESIQILNEYFGGKTSTTKARNSVQQAIPMSVPYLMTVNDDRNKKEQGQEHATSEAKEEAKQGASEGATKEAGTQSAPESILTCNPGPVSFYLPDDISDPTLAPQPMDKRVELKILPARVVAVRNYYGRFSKKQTAKEASKLFQELVANNFIDIEVDGSTSYIVAQYTLGKQFGNQEPLSSWVKNEIWVTLAVKHRAIQAMIAEYEKAVTEQAEGQTVPVDNKPASELPAEAAAAQQD